MADYLTTNWNHKIKTNPVANLILNSNGSGRKIEIQNKKLARLGDIGFERYLGFYDFGNMYADPVWLTENEYNYLQRNGNEKSTKIQKMSDDKKYALRERWSAPLLEEQERERKKKIKFVEKMARQEAKQFGYRGQTFKNYVGDAIKYADRNYDDEEMKDAGIIQRTSDEIEEELNEGLPYHEVLDTADDTDYWANCYVKDFINIQHPKLRNCHVSALSTRQVNIKPPSVFFSDI